MLPAMRMKVEKNVDPAEQAIGIVQGYVPGSKNEWYVAVSLDRLGIGYSYQVSIDGGRNIRGGQVIDFVVYNPRPIPVFVQGEYWHNEQKQNEDILKQVAAENQFGIKPILLMGEETDTMAKAYQVVKEKIK